MSDHPTLDTSLSIVGMAKLRRWLPRILQRMRDGDMTECIVLRHNKPVAVLLSAGEYQRLREIAEGDSR